MAVACCGARSRCVQVDTSHITKSQFQQMDHKKPKAKRAKRGRPVSEQNETAAMSLSALQAQGTMNFEQEARMATLERLNQMDMLRSSSSFLPSSTRAYPSEVDLLQRNYQSLAPNPLLNMQADLLALQGRRPQYFGTDSLAMSRSALLSALAMDQSQQATLGRGALIPGIADMAMPGAAVGLGDSAHAGNVDPFSRLRRDETVSRSRSAMLASMTVDRTPFVERDSLNRGIMDVMMREAAVQRGDRELVRNTKPLTDDKKEQLLTVAHRHSDIDDEGSESVSSSSEEEESPSQADKRRGAAEPFPEKLHRLIREVERAGQDRIISFTPDGKAFVIHKPEDFFSSIVPRYFKQSRFSSFKRQLNLYGFETVTSGPNKGGYNHEHFIREDPELCRHLKRRDVKFNARPKSKLGFDPDAPDFYKMPPIMSSEEAKTLADKQGAGSTEESDADET